MRCNRTHLLKLVRDKVNACREVLNAGELVAELVNPELRVRNTTVEPRLRVRLVLAVPVTPSWTTTHGDF
jgi:hypothetical protein